MFYRSDSNLSFFNESASLKKRASFASELKVLEEQQQNNISNSAPNATNEAPTGNAVSNSSNKSAGSSPSSKVPGSDVASPAKSSASNKAGKLII